MAKKHYDIERHGQADFFDNFHIDYLHDNSILIDNTDGVYHGNILEFKLNISNTGKVLLQAIKYLSRMRIKGESVPARIMLIDLNDTKVYVYHSADYIDDIQKVYVGASSVGNDAFNRNVTPAAIYDYTELVDAAEVQKLLINRAPANWYIPIDLDESCIVGWAERYYREIPNATKGDFLGDGTGKINLNGEIRDPKHFAGLINPYTEPTNEKFKYLMDCLNDRLNKKDLGAFYTPEPYCQKAAELVEMAVARVPDGNDYIILDNRLGALVPMPIYTVPSNTYMGIHVTITTDGNVLLGPTAEDTDNLSWYGVERKNIDYLYQAATKIWPHVKRGDYIRTYSGILPKLVDSNGVIQDFKIEIVDDVAPHAVNLVGIESPGLTAADAIADYVIDMMKSRVDLKENPKFNPIRKGIKRFADMTEEEQAKAIAENPDYGELICRCQKVSKAEILQAIHNPLGVHTMVGIKYRTRSMMGRCQGGYCQMRVAKMLEEAYGLSDTELEYNRAGSHLFFGETRDPREKREIRG